MHTKPIAEGGHQRRLHVLIVGENGALADPESNQVSVEQLRAKARVVPGRSAVRSRTATARKVAAKYLQRAGIDIGPGAVLETDKAAQMCRGPQVTDRARVSVPIAFERVCEAVDIPAARAGTQAKKRLGGAEVAVQHRDLLGWR